MPRKKRTTTPAMIHAARNRPRRTTRTPEEQEAHRREWFREWARRRRLRLKAQQGAA